MLFRSKLKEEEDAAAAATKAEEDAAAIKKAEDDAAVAAKEAKQKAASEAKESGKAARKVEEDTTNMNVQDEMNETATNVEITTTVANTVIEELNKAEEVLETKVVDGKSVKGEKQSENLEESTSYPVDTPSISVQYYTLEELKAGVPGVDYAMREHYLSDDVFFELFGMKKDQFLQMQTWKRVAAKKGIGLF